MAAKVVIKQPVRPAGGWGSVKAVGGIFVQQRAIAKMPVMMHQNKADGFACVSCSWAKPAHPQPFEFCENGAKATAWELTSRRVASDFFKRHSVAELLSWSDFELEDAGRLTVPLRYDAASDHYVEVSWDEAFRTVGETLNQLDPRSVVFYASGRASLETTFMYQLMARMYGSNNLPDSSNMCHESTAVGLKESIGVGVGTVQLEDFEHTDCLFFFGQNVGTNSPRMLHDLQHARERGVPIVTFNPILEAGLVAFRNPQSPLEMLTGHETRITTNYFQVKIGGDLSAITGICKAVIAADDVARETGQPRVLDVAFIDEHTHGFDAFCSFVRETGWDQIVEGSGLTRADLEEAAQIYCNRERVMIVYGMGLTQHRRGVENVQMVVNLLLLRGNIGKKGAGVCPVRGHSNVQGQRTVGMTEKPDLVPLDKLEALYHFAPPRYTGRNTVEACEGILDGSVNGFVSLGGNFVRAIPETQLMEAAWSRLRLSVQIATKLNRSHLIHGQVSLILPCLGRIEIDRQATGEQAVSVEDSTGCMHGSKGRVEPAAKSLLSEAAIVAGIAKATLAANPHVNWTAWTSDYALVRDAIEQTFPEIFHDFNARMWIPGGFHRPLAAANRVWQTPSKRANFVVPRDLQSDPDVVTRGERVLRLMTVRSDDQFNTTVYAMNDRFRGVYGTRMVLMMNAHDIERLGFRDGQIVRARSVVHDDVIREIDGFRIVAYDIPKECVAGYFPECNPLIPLWHHAIESKVPAAKLIPIELFASSATVPLDKHSARAA